MSYTPENHAKIEEQKPWFRLSPNVLRIFALQILFFGLLFLPNYSLFRASFRAEDYSRIVHVLTQILGNPAFYIVLMVSAIIYSFSFRMQVSDVVDDAGSVSVGKVLARSLTRIFILYAILFLLSWLFLTYKLMFMGNIYINPVVFRALGSSSGGFSPF